MVTDRLIRFRDSEEIITRIKEFVLFEKTNYLVFENGYGKLKNVELIITEKGTPKKVFFPKVVELKSVSGEAKKSDKTIYVNLNVFLISDGQKFNGKLVSGKSVDFTRIGARIVKLNKILVA